MDKDFFDLLNLDYPGLEEVKASVAAEDYNAAKESLVKYYRERTRPGWYWDNSSADAIYSYHDYGSAEEVLDRKFTILSKQAQLEKKVDWAANPYNDREWAWLLNRHMFFQTLGLAYLGSGEEKYAAGFNELLTDWVLSNPVPDKRAGVPHSWRTIEAGIRMFSSWPTAWNMFKDSPSFTTNARILMLKSFAEHGDYLLKYPSGGNWNLMENNGLLHVGALLPEFKDAETWREAAVERLVKQMEVQVYPDGMQFELTTSYHNVSLWNFLHPVALKRISDGIDFPPSYYETLRNMQLFNSGLQRPDGFAPMINDSDTGSFLQMNIEQITRLGGEKIPELKEFMEVRPAKESAFFPYSGICVMRTGDQPQDLYLMMDAGPFGAGHQHEDKLNLEVYAYGRPLIVDPGRFSYAAGGGFFRASGAHNVIHVDGMGQNRRATDRSLWRVTEPAPGIRWVSEPEFDYAEGVYDEGFGRENDKSVTHVRKVFFVKPEYWIVCDVLRGEGEHKFEQMWHFMPGSVESGKGFVKTVEEKSGNLSVVRSDSAEVRIVEGEETPILGFYSPRYNEREPSPTAVFTTTAETPIALETVLYPSPAGKSVVPVVTRLTCLLDGKRAKPGQVSAISVRLPGYEDIFVICHDEEAVKATKKCLGFTLTGEAVWLRVNASGEVVIGPIGLI